MSKDQNPKGLGFRFPSFGGSDIKPPTMDNSFKDNTGSKKNIGWWNLDQLDNFLLQGVEYASHPFLEKQPWLESPQFVQKTNKKSHFFSCSTSRFSSLIKGNKNWNIWVAIFGHILKGGGVGYWSNPPYQNLWKAGAKNGHMEINIWNLVLSLICSLLQIVTTFNLHLVHEFSSKHSRWMATPKCPPWPTTLVRKKHVSDIIPIKIHPKRQRNTLLNPQQPHSPIFCP